MDILGSIGQKEEIKARGKIIIIIKALANVFYEFKYGETHCGIDILSSFPLFLNLDLIEEGTSRG